MEHVASSALLEPSDHSIQERPLVFLDTDVILGYLSGDPSAAQLFSAEANGRIRFAVNGIVFQELLLAGDAAGRPEFERIIDHLQVLPVDLAKAEALFPRVRALGDRMHAWKCERNSETLGAARTHPGGDRRRCRTTFPQGREGPHGCDLMLDVLRN